MNVARARGPSAAWGLALCLLLVAACQAGPPASSAAPATETAQAELSAAMDTVRAVAVTLYRDGDLDRSLAYFTPPTREVVRAYYLNQGNSELRALPDLDPERCTVAPTAGWRGNGGVLAWEGRRKGSPPTAAPDLKRYLDLVKSDGRWLVVGTLKQSLAP